MLFSGVLSSSLFDGASCAACWACRRGEQRRDVTGTTLGVDASLGAGVTLGGVRCGAIGTRIGKNKGESKVTGSRMRAGVSGFKMKTLQGHRGGTISVLPGMGGGGTADTVVRPLMTVVVRRGKRRSGVLRGYCGG